MSLWSWLGGGPDEDYIDAGVAALQGGGPQRGNYQIDGRNFKAQQDRLYNSALAQQYDSNLANAARGQQQQATNLLTRTAQGNGPSLAQATLNRSLGDLNNQLQAAAFAQQGNRGAGLTQRNLLNAQVAAANNAQANAGIAGAQEQMGAMSQLANAAGALRQGDLASANAQGQFAQNRLAQAGGFSNAAYGANVNQAQANMAYDQARQNQAANIANIYNQQAAGVGKGIGDGVKNVAQAAATAAMASDMTMKQNISPVASLNTPAAHNVGIAAITGPRQDSGSSWDSLFAKPDADGKGGGDMTQLLSKLKTSLGGASTSAGGAAASGAGLNSDKGIKENVEPVANMLNNLKAYNYDYKEPEKYGEGRRMGIMAQDAQKSAMGSQMVNDQPGQPLSIDIPKAVSASLASVAYLNDRLNKLEGRGGKENQSG